MKLLVINPNTTLAVTELLRRQVQAEAGIDVTVQAASARFGASYIASETSFAIAAHAALDAYAAHCLDRTETDAVLVGCFGDPGVAALREATARPVVGLAEAAMREAARHGRFAIVTGGAAWQPMLARLARALDLADRLAGIHIVAPTGAQLAADRVMAVDVLRAACRHAALDADCVILGGAALAGMATAIAPSLAVPIVDSVSAGARAAIAAVVPAPAPTWSAADALGVPVSTTGAVTWHGLSPALTQLLR